MTLGAYYFQDPVNVLLQREASIEKRVKNCMGCKHLIVTLWAGGIIAECEKGRKAGRKSCELKSTEDK